MLNKLIKGGQITKNRKILFIVFSLLVGQYGFAQKWYYHSMHDKMAMTDTTKNLAELDKCDAVFNRVLVSRPTDSLALYYHILTNCLKHFYTQTAIYEEEQKKINASLKMLDSIFTNKEEIEIIELFYELLCADLNGDPIPKSVTWIMIVSLEKKYPNNPRLFFLRTFAKVKDNQLANEELKRGLKIYSEKYGVYESSNTLKINWGEKQIQYLPNIVSK